VIGVKEEKNVESFDESWVRTVVGFVEGVEHVEEDFSVGEVPSGRWRYERSSLSNSVSHRSESDRFSDDAEDLFVHDPERVDVTTSIEILTLKRRVRVGRVSGKSSETGSENCHWVRVESEAADDFFEVAMYHRVV